MLTNHSVQCMSLHVFLSFPTKTASPKQRPPLLTFNAAGIERLMDSMFSTQGWMSSLIKLNKEGWSNFLDPPAQCVRRTADDAAHCSPYRLVVRASPTEAFADLPVGSENWRVPKKQSEICRSVQGSSIVYWRALWACLGQRIHPNYKLTHALDSSCRCGYPTLRMPLTQNFVVI